MLEKNLVKVTLKSSDYTRALITDTAPFEVPIIFSNDGLYRNMKSVEAKDGHLKDFLNHIFNKSKFTIPYRYNIFKDSSSTRQLSLIHPSSQMDVCEFYKSYEQLICYYTSISEFSIRAPARVGSSYHFKSPIAEKNKYKGSTIDIADIDKLVQNPANFFAYRGYDLLYKFMNSQEFLALERKYNLIMSLDVSKCFPSIYTHSISWALKDIQTAKNYLRASHFGQDFDHLMQRMNYNETNGICVGAEVSRIFAELILSRIDVDVEVFLKSKKIFFRSDYEVRRYVDNIYIFANSESCCKAVQNAYRSCLERFKLHINERKTEFQARPFYTKKSKITDELAGSLKDFFDIFIEYSIVDGRMISYPVKMNSYNRLFKYFIRNVKSACFDLQANYADIANYVISAFIKRILLIKDDAQTSIDNGKAQEDDYVNAIILLMDLSFLFYNMNPTVASSLSISKGMIVSSSLFQAHFPLRRPLMQERIVRWTGHLIRDPRLIEISKNSDTIPIEILNVLIAMHDVAADHAFSEESYRAIFGNVSEMNYFSIISGLYILRDDPKFAALRMEIFTRAKEALAATVGLERSAHDFHLFFDLISCPFIEKNLRVTLYESVVQSSGFGSIGSKAAEDTVEHCEGMPWFVNWTGVNLFNMIQKKELSRVY